jgi:hypothetical protein
MPYPPIPATFVDAPRSRVILVPPDATPLIATIAKKQDEQLDYDFTYTRWLSPTDTILSVVASVSPQDPSVAIAGTQIDATGAIVKAWLQGGIGGMRYTVKLTVTTAAGRVNEQIIVLSILADRRASGDPEALADSASASAIAAAESALEAANSSVDAGASATASANSAAASELSNQASASSASAAHNSEVAADASADAAAASETNAGQSASDAAISAGHSSDSAAQASTSAGAAQQWATAAGLVGGIDYSAKYYAAQASTYAGNASTSAGSAATSATNASGWNTLAQAWASQAAGLVAGIDYSAKYYAGQAETSAANAAATLANALVRGNNLTDLLDKAAARTALSVQPTNNPAFTGNVGVPTRTPGDSSDNAASTAFVAAAMAPFSGRNRIINGACTITQRPAAAFNNGDGGFAGPDRFNCANSAGGSFSQYQSTLSYGGKTYNCVLQQVNTAMTDNSGTKFWTGIEQQIEGLNSYDLLGSPIAVSFVFVASQVGGYSVAIRDATGSYSYITSINVTTANVAQRYVILVPAIPLAANIPRTTGAGLSLWIGALSAGTYKTATLNSWQNGNYITANGTINWGTTVGATIAATLIQVEAGTVATPFEWRSVGHELMLCQRYFEAGTSRCYAYETAGVVASLVLSFVSWKRVIPTVGISVSNANNASNFIVYNVYSNSVMIGANAGGNGPVDFTFNYTASAEL